MVDVGDQGSLNPDTRTDLTVVGGYPPRTTYPRILVQPKR